MSIDSWKKRLQEEENHRWLQRQAIIQQNRQELSDAWYSRECPECAEIVKRKAKACNHCGFAFEDWEEQRKDIEHWEERAKALWPRRKLSAWETKKIEEAEYYFSPEGQAEQKRKEEKRKEEEEAKRREIEQRRKANAFGFTWEISKSDLWMGRIGGSILVPVGLFMILDDPSDLVAYGFTAFGLSWLLLPEMFYRKQKK